MWKKTKKMIYRIFSKEERDHLSRRIECEKNGHEWKVFPSKKCDVPIIDGTKVTDKTFCINCGVQYHKHKYAAWAKDQMFVEAIQKKNAFEVEKLREQQLAEEKVERYKPKASQTNQ